MHFRRGNIKPHALSYLHAELVLVRKMRSFGVLLLLLVFEAVAPTPVFNRGGDIHANASAVYANIDIIKS